MSPFLDSIVALSGPLVYVIVGALAFGEAAAFVGLVLPGETALFLGGVIASQGNVKLGWVLTIAIVAAIAGDSVGYEMGRRFGPSLKKSRAGRFVGTDKWSKGEQFLSKHGGKAVLLGRWVGLLRALVPAIAGMSRMRYRTFLLYNAIGGTVWAVVVVLLGFYAGQSYKSVEKYLGRASLILSVVLVGVLLIALAARFALRHPDRTQQWVGRLNALPPFGAIKRQVGAPPAAGRQDIMEKTCWWAPVPAGVRIRGILAVGLVVLVAGYSWISTTQAAAQVLGGLDGTIETWFLEHQGDEFSIIMQVLVAVGHPLLALAALLFCVLLIRSGPVERPILFAVYLSVCLLVATAIATLVAHLALPGSVASTMGLGLGSEAGQTLISTSLLTGSAWLIIRRYSAKWRRMVLTVTGLVAITPLIALSHAYQGEQEPSQLAVGWLLGTLFAAASSASWPVAKRPAIPAMPGE